MADKDEKLNVVTLPDILAAHVRVRTREEVLKRPLVIDDDMFFNADKYLTSGDEHARNDTDPHTGVKVERGN